MRVLPALRGPSSPPIFSFHPELAQNAGMLIRAARKEGQIPLSRVAGAGGPAMIGAADHGTPRRADRVASAGQPSGPSGPTY